MHTYKPTHAYLHTYIIIHAFIHTYIGPNAYIHIHYTGPTCLHTYIHTCILIHTCTQHSYIKADTRACSFFQLHPGADWPLGYLGNARWPGLTMTNGSTPSRSSVADLEGKSGHVSIQFSYRLSPPLMKKLT